MLDTPFNIVLMGMGEPLHNYDETMKALRLLADEHGLGVSPRRVTLSTVGLVPMLDRLAAEPLMPNLAISLHATTEEQREALVPPTKKVLAGRRPRRLPRASRSRKRSRITFEYVLLDGVNDTPEDARRLVRLLAGIKAKVNLIPLNAAPGIPFERPSDQRVDQFARILAERGLLVSVRKSRGRDIRAACGQLIVEGQGRRSPAQQLSEALVTRDGTVHDSRSCTRPIAHCRRPVADRRRLLPPAEPRTFKQLLDHVAALEPPERGAAIDRFIAARGGTPVIENQSKAIFLVQDQGRRRRRESSATSTTGPPPPTARTPSVGVPTRIEGTDWSYLEASIYTNARAEYVLLFPTEAVADPKNPRTVNAFAGPRSEVRMPQWVGQPEIDDRSDVPAGTVVGEAVTSKALGTTRRVWFYTPPGYDDEPGLVSGAVRARRRELRRAHADADDSGSADRPKGDSAAGRGVRRARRNGRRSTRATRGGGRSWPPSWCRSSTSGSARSRRRRSACCWAARCRLTARWISRSSIPAVFGLCAALAPPAQTPTVITNQAKGRDAIRAVRFFVLAGTYDSMANGGRRLRTALDIGTGAVTYIEVPEGHSTETFRGHLDDALKALLPQGS